MSLVFLPIDNRDEAAAERRRKRKRETISQKPCADLSPISLASMALPALIWHCTGGADASSLFSELGTNSRAPLRTCAMIINYPNIGFIHIHAHLGRWMEMVIPTSKRNHDGSYVYKYIIII